jgi:hypothetical protein
MVPQFRLTGHFDLVTSVTSLAAAAAGCSVGSICTFDGAVLQGPFPEPFWCVFTPAMFADLISAMFFQSIAGDPLCAGLRAQSLVIPTFVQYVFS